MSPITYSGASCSSTASRAAAVEPRLRCARDRLDQQRVLRDREDMRAHGLAVPARDAGEPVRDVLDLDVERRGIEQVEPAARQHALPGAADGSCADRRGFVGVRVSAVASPSVAARLVAVALHQMVVDHADRLHEGIDDGRADELEAARRQAPSTSPATARSRPAPAWWSRNLLTFGLPSRKSHSSAEKPGPFSMHLEIGARRQHRALDLERLRTMPASCISARPSCARRSARSSPARSRRRRGGNCRACAGW